jgi:hypothetical protein
MVEFHTFLSLLITEYNGQIYGSSGFFKRISYYFRDTVFRINTKSKNNPFIAKLVVWIVFAVYVVGTTLSATSKDPRELAAWEWAALTTSILGAVANGLLLILAKHLSSP